MEATSTLADALLDDLDDLSAVDVDEEDDDDDDDNDDIEEDNDDMNTMGQYGNDDDDDNAPEDDGNMNSKKNKKKRIIYENLIDDPKFVQHIQTIKEIIHNNNKKDDTNNNTDTNDITTTTTTYDDHDDDTKKKSNELHDPNSSNNNEYNILLLQQTNYYLTLIQSEIQKYYTNIITIYQNSFPQLEDIISNPIQYMNVVSILLVQQQEQQQQQDQQSNTNNNSILNINNNSGTILSDQLHQYVSPQQIITLSVAYSTSNGRSLTVEEVQVLQSHIRTIQEHILPYQSICIQYIEKQMTSIVPNMVQLLNSSHLVAQLLSYTNGSLEQLVKIPACNIQLLGQMKQSNKERGSTILPFLTNSSSNNNSSSVTKNMDTTNISNTNNTVVRQVQQPHMGVLVQCDLIQSVPIAIQRKVLKMVASKLVLCIRCDYDYYIKHGPHRQQQQQQMTENNNTPGYIFRQQILKKIQQLLEPEKAPILKALPKPDLTVKKRRGGQRMRRLKGRYEETTLMKQANTRAFSVQTGEYGDDAMGRTLGLLEMSTGSVGNTSNTNEYSTIRNKNHIEMKKMKYANTRASRKKAAALMKSVRGGSSNNNNNGISTYPSSISNNNHSNNASTTSSGLVSSIVFTPVQGMELVNPDAQKDRIKEANRKWFQDNAGFQSALPKR